MVGVARAEFDVAGRRLVLHAEMATLAHNALFTAYLRQKDGRILSATEVAIPTDPDALHARYQEVSRILERAGFRLEAAGDVGDALRRVQDEEAAFAEFSAIAASIWNGDVNIADFDVFVRAIRVECPGRRFYPRQILAAYHLAFALNACNFSVPGAGKTSIVYASYAYLRSLPPDHARHIDRILVVGPLSSFKAWEDEYRDIFDRPASSRRIAGFTSSEDRRAFLRGIAFDARDVEVTLTTYSTFANSSQDFIRFVSMPGTKTMVVLDEAHYIKREDGYWAAAALRIAPHAAARVLLTGTPAPNGYEDLTNLFRFIYPRKNIIGYSTNTLRAMSGGALPSAVQRLKQNVRPFYTRIRKRDLGLPGITETRDAIGFSQTHQRIYSGIERAILPQIRAAIQGGRSTLVRARLMRLRQAAVNPALLMRPLEEEGLLDADAASVFSVPEREVAALVSQFDARRDLLRLNAAISRVRDVIARQRKVVIWSYFLGNLALLRSALQDEADFVEVITGATPVADDFEALEAAQLETREAFINRFHDARERSILIANPQAVGESISLHKACRTAIYFDRDFNAGRFIQSKDRIHRYSPAPIGDVDYFFLVAPNTIEDVIDSRLVQKEQRLANLIDTDEIPLFTLGDEDSEERADVRAVLEEYERRKAI